MAKIIIIQIVTHVNTSVNSTGARFEALAAAARSRPERSKRGAQLDYG